MKFTAVAASVSLGLVMFAGQPCSAQGEPTAPRWRGPVRVIKTNGGTTKSIKIGRQTFNVTVNLVRRPFGSDALAASTIPVGAALSGTITISPTKRGQVLPAVEITGATFARTRGKQKDFWLPHAADANIASGTLMVPFITSGGIGVGGASFTAPAGKSFSITDGPGDWDNRSKLSGTISVSDGRKSYRINLSKLPVTDLTPPPPPPPPPGHEVDPERELIIRDLSVVESNFATEPDGAWTFGNRFRSLFASDDEAKSALRHWLGTWETDQVVNDQTVPARTAIREAIIEPWKARSGQAGVPDELWNIVWDDAPFRLLAIVNRTDLSGLDPNGRYGQTLDSAGEGRFVFGAVDSAGEPLPFTLIFEYRQPGGSFFDVSNWAVRWHALGEKAFGAEYNNDLRTITNDLVALNQLRTGEAALDGTWQFREFTLDAGELRPADAKATPANHFNGTPTLARFVNESEEVGASVPLVFDNLPFRAGVSDLPAGFVWNADGADQSRRASMALLTCNGCHHRETGTDSIGSTTGAGAGFVHISPRRAGEKAQLSGFLRGDNAGGPLSVNDPVSGEPREFNELAERKRILQALAESQIIFFTPAFDFSADTGAADLREAAIKTMQFTRRGRVH